MTVVGAFEAKTKLSELLDRVEQGEEVTITRHGEPIAKLVPTGPSRTAQEEGRRLIERWLARPDRPRLDGLTIQELRDEGRR